jgi:hypothetical protein
MIRRFIGGGNELYGTAYYLVRYTLLYASFCPVNTAHSGKQRQASLGGHKEKRKKEERRKEGR